MAKQFNLPKVQTFKPTKSLHSTGVGSGDYTDNSTNTYYYPSGLLVNFSTATTSGDPGAGVFRFNSATPASITKMYISDLDQNSDNQSAWYGVVTSGVLRVNKVTGGTVTFSVTRMQDKSGYFEFDVEYLSGTLPADGNCYVDFVPDAPGVRVYEATIAQITGSASVASLFSNSLGTVSLSSVDTGVTIIESTGAFAGSTFVNVEVDPYAVGTECLIGYGADTPDTIKVTATNSAGTQVDEYTFRITIKTKP